ncbi:MAG TPA: hypothetical protein VF203_11870 [Burkholderiales bacterium]
MADSNQYLCLVLGGMEYLLPGAASVAIEQRHALIPEDGRGPLVAWRQSRQGRWPVYGLDGMLRPSRPETWQRAVFLDGSPTPVGLAAEEVRLLGRADLHITPFAPLGAPPTRAGHYFDGAWVDGHKVVLVFAARGLAEALRAGGAGVRT